MKFYIHFAKLGIEDPEFPVLFAVQLGLQGAAASEKNRWKCGKQCVDQEKQLPG